MAGAAQNRAQIKQSEWRSAGPFDGWERLNTKEFWAAVRACIDPMCAANASLSAAPRCHSRMRLNAGTILTDGRALLLLGTH